ncbi:MFS transporter [Cellulomonas endophytica]|uniref:MFS transporter n=1 Tax=Cellulomonas endophytica TaxID=2494735 RepID=UPI001F0C4237|nr:MFS transporter [Cellulomonas endophytica]
MPSALAHPTYRVLLTGQVVSLVGTGLTTVALGLLAYDMAGRDAGLVLGTVFAIKMVAYVVLAPVAAAVVHARPTGRVLVGADLVRVVAVAGLPLVDRTWHVYALVLVLQAASAVHTPAFAAALPRVLPDDRRYTQALSASRVAEDLEMVAAPLLAALLLLVLPSSALFWGTAAGFAASAALLLRVRLPAPVAAGDAPAPDGGGVRRRAGRGIALLARTPALRPVLALDLAVAAAGAFVLVQTVVLARTTLGLGEDGAAALLGAVGAGSVLVALVLPRVLGHVPEGRLLLTGAAVAAAGCALVPAALAAPGPASAAVAVAALWVAVGAGWSAAETPVPRILRRHVADTDLPAVLAAQFSLSHACWLVTYPLVGWLGTVLGLGAVALVCAALAGGATIAAALLLRRAGAAAPGRAAAVAASDA